MRSALLRSACRCRYASDIDSPGIYRIARSFIALICVVLATTALQTRAESLEPEAVERGAYIYHMAGCASCHTNSKEKKLGPAGNVPLDTPFGILYAPNITPDKVTGIGGWSASQFVAAMRNGVSPEGEHYFPAFPYTSYTRMADQDLLDLKAYLDSILPVRKRSKDHDLSFPFDQRWLMGFWKAMFFDKQIASPDTARSALWNRGAYIVNGPGHCAECHTPRNLLGSLKQDELLAGNPQGPEGGKVPAINPYASESFRQWSKDDIVFSLQTGMLPNGDFLGSSMGHVIENSTSRLTQQDLEAIAEYLHAPGKRAEPGLLESLFGMVDAGAEQGNANGHGHDVIQVPDVVFWFIWPILLGGGVLLILRRSMSTRILSNAGEGKHKDDLDS